MKKTAAFIFALIICANGYGTVMDSMFKNGALRFDYSAKEMLKMERDAALEFEAAVNKILETPAGERTFDNTVLAFERAYTNYWYVPKALALLTYFHWDGQVRNAAASLETKGSQFRARILARKDIYNALKEYTDKRHDLGAEQEKLVSFWLAKFERAGVKLEGQDGLRYATLTKDKMDDITKFNVNIMEHDDRSLLTREELEGLSEVYINRLPRTEDGRYIVSLKYPDYNPFMANAKNEAARKELQIKFANRGGQENVKLLEKVLMARSETSRLLGYADHPQYVLEERLAKTDAALDSFLSSIEAHLKKIGKRELKEYKKLKRKMTRGVKGTSKGFNLWDYPYYYNQYMKQYYNVDHEKIKEYFPADAVIEGMFEVFGNLFGLSFVKVDLPAWHKDVLVYQIKDKETGALISNFYMDLYPRDGKYTHAACWSFVDGHVKVNGSYQIPSVVIASNLNPPGGDLPSLLNHSEVETLFHEFGHVLQMSLTHPSYASLGGDNMVWDYIETHSQLLENWAWEEDVLKKISKHYLTGEPLPQFMVDSLVASKHAGAALPMLRQNFQGQLDYVYHKANAPVDTTAVYEELIKKIYMIPNTPGTHPQSNFAHIMSLTDPYDVGYYVYAWSLVIADDIFAQFKEKGIYDKELGAKLRQLIYTPGMTEDPNKMTAQFLGRPYDNINFLENFGVKLKKKEKELIRQRAAENFNPPSPQSAGKI